MEVHVQGSGPWLGKIHSASYEPSAPVELYTGQIQELQVYSGKLY